MIESVEENYHRMKFFPDVRSIISEGDEAAWWAEEEHCSTDSWSEIPCVHLLEKFSSESPRGSNKADVQLR